MAYHSPATSRKNSASSQGHKTPTHNRIDRMDSVSSGHEGRQKGRDGTAKLPQDLTGLNDYVSVTFRSYKM